MLRLDVYEYGSGVKSRLHDHPYARDDRCDPECYDYATERSYGAREDRPADRRKAIVAAALTALMTPALGHVAFLNLLADQPRLDLGD